MKKKEIQVLYIVTKLELGGAQKVCLSLLNGLRNAGHTSLLISVKEGALSNTLNNTEKVFLLDSLKREVSFFGIFSEFSNFINLIRLIRKLKKEYPNLIVHTHSTKAGLIGRWAALFAGVKKRIHTVHGFGFHPFQNKFAWLFHYIFEALTAFITTKYICVSTFDVKTGKRLLPFFKKRHSIIRASVDERRFIPVNTPPQKNSFIFGTIACFKKQKNIFDLLKAFARCSKQQPNAYLEIIGDGHLRKKIEGWINHHKLSQKITLLGWQNNVASFMKNWDSFISTSLWEGLPCAIVEARLLKLPVISYDTGGIHDVISHNGNGLLFKPKDWQSLAQGMLKITNNKPFHEKLKSYPDDLYDFTLTTMINSHIALYKSNIH